MDFKIISYFYHDLKAITLFITNVILIWNLDILSYYIWQLNYVCINVNIKLTWKLGICLWVGLPTWWRVPGSQRTQGSEPKQKNCG